MFDKSDFSLFDRTGRVRNLKEKWHYWIGEKKTMEYDAVILYYIISM